MLTSVRIHRTENNFQRRCCAIIKLTEHPHTELVDFKVYFAANERIDIQLRFIRFTLSIVIAKNLSRCILVVKGKF